MGRHHIKLPDHLYLAPPSPQPPTIFASAFPLFSSRTALSYPASFFLHSDTTTRAFERRIPGFRTSAAFFTALRANIDLQSDGVDSPANTPDSLRPLRISTTSYLPPPSPLFQAMSSQSVTHDADFAPPSGLKLRRADSADPEEEDVQPLELENSNAIPELITSSANDDASKVEALRLVADSVAQQRQRASRALIFHPLTLLLLTVIFGALRQYFYKGSTSDYAIIATTFAGVVMTLLVAIRAQTGAYIEEAERVGTWNWLSQGRSPAAESRNGQKVLGDRDDEILVTKFGDEYIGTIIFRGVQSVDETQTKKSSRKTTASQPKTEIRAWTVRQKYRSKGVGTALLEDAIKIAHKNEWTQGGVDIATDHANSKVVLPSLLSGFVQKNGELTSRYVDWKVKEFEEAYNGRKAKRRR